MAKTVSSMSQLINEIKSRCQKAVQMTRDEIYETIDTYLYAFYGDYSPVLYARTYRFADSLIKLDVSVSGTSVSAEVKIDEGYLGSTYSSGDSPTGMQVAEAANSGLHGAVGLNCVPGSISFWNDALNNLGGEAGIEAKLIANLKACGL